MPSDRAIARVVELRRALQQRRVETGLTDPLGADFDFLIAEALDAAWDERPRFAWLAPFGNVRGLPAEFDAQHWQWQAEASLCHWCQRHPNDSGGNCRCEIRFKLVRR